jgi:hypothetical protein
MPPPQWLKYTGLLPTPCLSGPWLHNPFVGQLLWAGGGGCWKNRSPFVQAQDRGGGGVLGQGSRVN